MAARIRRELDTEVEMVRGRYGEFKVSVNGETIIDGGSKVILGIMPPGDKIIETVRQRLIGET